MPIRIAKLNTCDFFMPWADIVQVYTSTLHFPYVLNKIINFPCAPFFIVFKFNGPVQVAIKLRGRVSPLQVQHKKHILPSWYLSLPLGLSWIYDT